MRKNKKSAYIPKHQGDPSPISPMQLLRANKGVTAAALAGVIIGPPLLNAAVNQAGNMINDFQEGRRAAAYQAEEAARYDAALAEVKEKQRTMTPEDLMTCRIGEAALFGDGVLLITIDPARNATFMGENLTLESPDIGVNWEGSAQIDAEGHSPATSQHYTGERTVSWRDVQTGTPIELTYGGSELKEIASKESPNDQGDFNVGLTFETTVSNAIGNYQGTERSLDIDCGRVEFDLDNSGKINNVRFTARAQE